MSSASLKDEAARPVIDLFSGDTAAGVFLPCNRESALLVLAALCVGDVVPCELDLAIVDGHVALLRDGLRADEGVLLSAGDPRCFPVLLELSSDAVLKSPSGQWFVCAGELRRLVFQSQEHADEFRYRPVDEVNTETQPFHVDPARFTLEGPSRISIERHTPTSSSLRADRLAAAVHCVIALAESHPELRSAALKFFDKSAAASTAPDAPGFGDFSSALFAPGQQSSLLCSVAAAFAGGVSAQEIVSSIRAAHQDDEKVQVWASTARDVLQNRIELSGSRLTDEGRLLLRGAILALTAETPRAIDRFLLGEKAPGPAVTVLAAFLGGLRRGVLNMSWSEKAAHGGRLSRLMAALLSYSADSDGRLPQSDVQRVGQPLATQITVAGVPVSEWPAESSAPSAAAASGLKEPLEKEGFEVVGAGESPDSVVFALGSFMAEAVLGSDGLCMLKVFADPARKLRKKSDITEAFKSGGALWYPGPLDEERKFLFCDLPHVPRASERALLTSKLADAFSQLLAAEKAKRSRPSGAKTPKKSKASQNAARGTITGD